MKVEQIRTSKGYTVNVIESYAVYMSPEEYYGCEDLTKYVLDAVLSVRPLKEDEGYGFGKQSSSPFTRTCRVHIFKKGDKR